MVNYMSSCISSMTYSMGYELYLMIYYKGVMDVLYNILYGGRGVLYDKLYGLWDIRNDILYGVLDMLYDIL